MFRMKSIGTTAGAVLRAAYSINRLQSSVNDNFRARIISGCYFPQEKSKDSQEFPVV